MLKRYFNSLSTSKKIFLCLLAISIISQIFIGILACSSIMKISYCVQTQSGHMEDSTSDNCEFILKNQEKRFLSDISSSVAQNFDLATHNLENQADSLCSYAQNLYSAKYDLGKETNLKNSNSENTFGYIIDNSVPSNTQDNFMVCDFPENLSEIFYKTTIESWNSLSDEQKNEIKNNKIIVSENKPKEEVVAESDVVRNLLCTAKSIYKSDESILKVSIATQSGIFYQMIKNGNLAFINPRQTDWYKDSFNSADKQSGKWQKSLSYTDSENPSATYSKTFFDGNNKPKGVVAIELDVKKFLLGRINNYPNSNKDIFILDNNTGYVLNQNNIIIQNSDSSESCKNLISLMQNGDNGVSEIFIGDDEYLVGYSNFLTLPLSLGIAEKSDFAKSESQPVKNELSKELEDSKKLSGSNTSTVLFQFFIICCAFSLIMYAVCRSISLKIMPIVQRQTDKLKHIDSELNMAQKIQKGMLPKTLSNPITRDDFEIYATNVPVEKLGGDFYDFFLLDKNHLAIAIADTSDKGVPAALFMSAAKNLLKTQLKSHKSLSDAVEAVNDNLYENNDMRMFVTAFVGIINLNNGLMEFINAGHTPPLVYNSKTAKFEFLDVPHNCALGAIKNKKYLVSSTTINKNDILLLYTDGVTETRGKNNELFSQERLKVLVNNLDNKKVSMKKLILCIQEEIDEFSENPEANDDITMLGFRNL